MSEQWITLHGIEGTARLSGTDEDDLTWIEFKVDVLAEQTPGECLICGKEVWEGWGCMEGGDEVCEEHVRFVEEEEHKWLRGMRIREWGQDEL